MSVKKITTSLLACASAVGGVFFFVLGAAAMGSGLSNAQTKGDLNYIVGKVVFYGMYASAFIVPVVTALGLYLYWSEKQQKISGFLMFSSLVMIATYFVLVHLGALIYLGIRELV